MRPWISNLCPRLIRAVRANSFAVCALVLVTLATVLVPQSTRASGASRELMLADLLRYMRTQIQVYQGQHAGQRPGMAAGATDSTPDAGTFIAQMTQYTDESGTVIRGPSKTRVFGPYLLAIPENPFNSRDGILIVPGATFPVPDDSQPYGWMYSPTTGRLTANVEGVGSDGVRYMSY